MKVPRLGAANVVRTALVLLSNSFFVGLVLYFMRFTNGISLYIKIPMRIC